MASLPITREDFIEIGERFASEDIVGEIDRLAPVAKADIDPLTEGGYEQEDLDKLLQYRNKLSIEAAERRTARGAKKGARVNETEAILAGKRVLRRGIAMALSALSKRAPDGEDPVKTRETAATISNEINSLNGRIGMDSPKLRTHLLALRSILTKDVLAPTKGSTKALDTFLAKLDAAIATLPALAEAKKGYQEQAKMDTADLDEIDGRAYWNLKRLTQTGRSYWLEQGNASRAQAYTLTGLRSSSAKPKAPEPKTESATPTA